VKNTGDVWLEFIRISATLKAQNGSILDISFTYTYLDRLPPSETAGFDVLEVNAAKSAATESYSLSLEFHEAASRTVRLQIINVGTSRNVFQWLEILGEVQNNGDSVSEYTMVIGTFYGSDGKVVYVAFTYTDPSTIQPGAKQAFKLSVTGEDRSNLVANYSLTGESSQYTSIPELPWHSAIISGIALCTTMVFLGTKRREYGNELSS